MVNPISEVHLLHGVPLFHNNPHTLTWSSEQEQRNYFTSRRSGEASFLNLTYTRDSYTTIMVEQPKDRLQPFNYMMFRNNAFLDKWFYAFITDIEYLNPEVCRVHYEIDVFQTWYFHLNYMRSYVERAHVPRWSGSNPIIHTAPEGLDYGTEYETVHIEQVKPSGENLFLVIVSKATLHGTSAGRVRATNVGLPQGLNYYVHPFRLNGSQPTVSIGGSVVPISSILNFIQSMYSVEGAVENIVSMYVTEFIGLDLMDNYYNIDFPSNWFERAEISDNINLNATTIYAKDFWSFLQGSKILGNKYNGFHRTNDESKMLMYPYAYTELTDFKGNTVVIKNEYIKGDNLELRFWGGLSPSAKVIYQVKGYKAVEGDWTQNLDHALVSNNPNDLPVLVDMLSAYLQGNRNSIENQKQQIIWSNLSSIMGGAVSGGMVGGATGAIGGSIAGAGGGMISSYYQIQGLNAKQKDISNVPPQLSKLGGNAQFDFGNGLIGCYVVKKQITAENRDRLAVFWKMYGYQVNMLQSLTLRTRQHFNYIKTVDAQIFGSIPQNDLIKIRELFNNGVTLWHHPTYVGEYYHTNNEV